MTKSTPHGGDNDPDPGLTRLNALTAEDLRTELAQCLDIDRWVRALASEAPFPDRDTLLKHADTHARTITGEEVAGALARHPRIGEKAKGKNTEAGWSRGEQSAFAAGTDAWELTSEDSWQRCRGQQHLQDLLIDTHRRR